MLLEEFLERYRDEHLTFKCIERGRVKYENCNNTIEVTASINGRSDFEFNETPWSIWTETDHMDFKIKE